MLKKTFLVFALFALSLICFGCGDTNVNITASQEAAEGLDLEAAGKLAAESSDADDFARKLNSEKDGIGINNLDLNGDGKPELLVVTEDGTGSGDLKVFIVTAVLSGQDLGGRNGQQVMADENIQKQHVADFRFEREQQTQVVAGAQPSYGMTVTGNQQIYGDNHHYHTSGLSATDILLLSWAFGSRPVYYPAYNPWYPSYGIVPHSLYRTRTVGHYTNVAPRVKYTRTVPVTSRSHSYRPTTTRYTTPKITAPLRSPSQAQGAFQRESNPNKAYSGGAFSKSPSSSGGSVRPSSGGSAAQPSKTGSYGVSRPSTPSPSRTGSYGSSRPSSPPSSSRPSSSSSSSSRRR